MLKDVFKGKKKLSFYMIIIFVLLVGITLGSALLSSTLKVIGNSIIKKNSWVIYFDDIDIAEDSAPVDNSNDNARISKNGVADPTKQNIEFTASLKDPGDFYEFTVWTVNDGSIDAEVESLEKSTLTEEQQKYLDFDVTYDDGTPIQECDFLYHKGSDKGPNKRLIKAVVKYKEGLNVNDYPSEGVTLNLYFKINYSQNVICSSPHDEVEKYKLTIRPNGGVYDGRKAQTRKYLEKDEEYILKRPTRDLYNFDGWKVIDPETGGTFSLEPYEDKYKFTMGSEDVIIEAKWKEGDYVARIMDHYYTKVELAFDAVDGNNPSTGRPWENNTVWLLRDTDEVAYNNAKNSFTFNLDGHTLTGKIVNPTTGKITLVDGRIQGSSTVEESEKQRRIDEGKDPVPFVNGISGEAVLNYGTLTLGKDDSNVEVENSISLSGEQYGLFNVSNSKFNFYDGYVQGREALSGMISQLSNGDVKVATSHMVFVDSVVENNKEYQKVYLVPSPNRAVAKTTTVVDAYYYTLQDAIDTVIDTKNKNSNLTDSDYVIDAIRTFEAAYDLNVERKDSQGNPIETNTNNARVFFDLKGYSVQTGENIVNKGYFKIYNSKNNQSILKTAKSITNEGNLEIDNINIPISTDADGIVNKGHLKLSDVIINSHNAYCVKNIENGTLDFNPNVVLKSINKDDASRSDQYALYNSGTKATINNGTIYGLQNTGTITLDGENTKYLVNLWYIQNGYHYYIRAINNSGTINMNNGIIETNIDTGMIYNTGTFTFNDGTISSEYLAVENSGTFNVKGSEVTSSRTAITGGIVNVDGGDVRTSSSEAINASTIYVKSGEVIAEDGIVVGDRSTLYVQGGTVTGTTYGIYGERSSVNVSAGTLTAPIAANVSSATVTGGKVIGSEYAIIASNTTIGGGEITSPKNSIVTTNLTMSDGKVDCENEVGIVINGTGNITGGEVYGGTYGVHSKNTLTLGSDDGEISSTSPMLEGELFGLYIEGNTTNFYDGILKGQTDGYEGSITGLPLGGVVGEGVEDRGEDGVYNTDFVSSFDGWLRIADTPYNTLNAASQAALPNEETIIIVTRDADVKFSQKVLDENNNKKIILDLNGHKVTTTQNITNYSNLTIIDSAAGTYDDTGTGPGTIKILKNDGIVNYNKLIINDGRFEGITNQIIYNKTKEEGQNGEIIRGTEINGGTFSTTNSVITNGVYEDSTNKQGYVVINGINVETSYDTIINTQGKIVINGTKNKNNNKYTTVINASNNCVNNEGEVYINGGKINTGTRVVTGDNGYVQVNEVKNVNLNDDNQIASTVITSTNEYALYSYWGTIDVNGGNVTSTNNTAIVGHHPINVNGGTITGTRGIKNEIWCTWAYCSWEPITITGGTIIGTQYEGVYFNASRGYNSYVYGGTIIGNTDGAYSNSTVFIGKHNEGLSITSPEFRGINGYGYNNNGYMNFYDGILKGKKKDGIANSSHNGMIQNIEDATQVKRDYEYINNVYYETEYLETQGDWLEIEGKGTFNTVDKACSAASNGDTIKVIADTHIAFAERCEGGKNLTFDENGHSVSFTQSITFDSNIKFIDSVGNGLLNNKRNDMIISNGISEVKSGTYRGEGNDGSIPFVNGGTSTITGGDFESVNSVAIHNNGTMIFNDTEDKVSVTSETTYGMYNGGTLTFKNGNIKTYGGLDNTGTFTMENGTIEGTDTYSLDGRAGMSTLNGGTIINNQGVSANFHCSGDFTMNGGKIISTTTNALYASGGGTSCDSSLIYINGGDITGKTNGIAVPGGATALEVNGGHIIGQENNGININNVGTQINGGVIEGGTYGVYTNQDYESGITQIGNNDRDVAIDSPVLKGELYGLYINRGTLNFYDGILKGQNEGFFGQITNIADRTQLYYDDDEVIDEVSYQVVYLLTEKVIVKNIDKPSADLDYTEYSNLQDAFNYASNGDRLVLVDNAPIYYEVTNNKNVSLDMNGYTISTNKKITNNGELVIKNTSNKVSTIKTSAAMSLITSTNSLELDNITLKNNSSSYYVVQATGDVILKNTTINSIYGINSSQSLNITDSEITCSRTAINSSGSININGGTYSGSDYSIYSSTTKNINIKDAVLNGTYYNEGSNTAHIEDSTINGEFQTRVSNTTVLKSTLNRDVSNTGTLLVDTSHINDSISNTGTMTLLKSEVKGLPWDSISNTGTMTIKDSTTDLTSYYYYYNYTYTGINNSGILTIDNSTINQDLRETNSSTVNAISNTGTLTIRNNTTINAGTNSQTGGYIRGIYTSGNGIANITDSLINVTSGSTNYGVYLDSDTSKIVLETGTINAINSSITYGAYINRGTFELGKKLTAEDTDRTVSQENPRIYSAGTSRGIGVKKFTANFNFYDGVIYGSKYAKPDTTTNVESLYEVTTYVQEETGFEYAWLEFMGDDYQVSDTVASITRGLDIIQYPTVQDAINACAPGEEITLLKSTSEPLDIPSDKIIALNLNNRSLTSKIINDGILQVYNGSIQNFDDIAIVNAGTLIMGQDDDTVSSTSVRIVSESTAIKQNGTFVMYDGYIEGNPSINGEITEIADFSRIYTVKDNQSEKKYLQSLDENSIRNRDTALFITIDPLSGYYDGVKGQKLISQFYGDVVKIKDPIKGGCTFLGWDITGDATLIPIEQDTEDYTNGYRYKFTVGLTDVTLKAKWEVSESAVAKIGEEYFDSVADALMEAKENDTVELIKNVVEDVSNDKNITLNLGGYKLTGEFINNGILRVVNGTIENPDGVGLWNKKTLIVGENDGTISSDSIKIIGTTIGIEQDGGLKFYDGTIEGKVALNGDVDQVPKGYFLYIEHNDEKDCQVEYLIGNPQNAVAIIKSGSGEEETVQYFFSLQDAIDTATISGKEIFIVKDFIASYTVNIKQNANIVINLNGCNVQLGNTFTNNGTLKLYDTIEADDNNQTVTKGTIISAKTIENNGTMTIEDISISQNKNEITILNNEGATLNLNGTQVEAKDNYAVKNIGNINLSGDYLIKANVFGLYNSGNPLVLNSGTIYGLETTKDLTIEDGVTINTLSTTNASVALRDTLTFKMTGGTITGSTNDNGIYNSGAVNATISGGTITAGNAIYCAKGTSTYTINGGTIEGASAGIDLQADYCNLVMNNGNVTGTNYGVYSYGQFNDIKVNNGIIKSTSGIGIRDDRYKGDTHANDFTCTINGGKVIGATHGMEVRNSTITMNGGELTTTSTNRDHYAFYADYWNTITLNDGALINAPNASGIRCEGVLNMEDGAKVYSGARNGYAIRGYYMYATINGGTIEAPGDASYAILSTDNYYCNVTINDGLVTSGNIGIGLHNTSGNYDRVLTINGGTISGEQYGIYQPGNYTTTIGSNDKELSTTIPIITGGLYGIYRTGGTTNFYNGRLRGITSGYSGDIDSVRKGKEIIRIEETIDKSENYTTYSTDLVSEIPTSQAAKKGHGYAKITYISDTTAGCENGREWPFDYTGEEEVFNVTCPGKYKLEVWGAQGGSSDETIIGGYGGYSKGEINLTTGEKLYINVGGQPISTTGGYNGGGTSGTLYNARGGGGATHIALTSGLLATLENKQDKILIVAGAGGGSDHYLSGSIGGHAGGYVGGNGNKFREWDTFQIALGGSQNYGGYGGHGACYGTDGTFGAGGSQCNSHGGGGGAGFYGGGGGGYNNDVVGSGAGGSGYIGNARLINKEMYGYNAKTSTDRWIVNYLADKENFLQVDDMLFNSINDATKYIEDNKNGTGTILLLKSTEIQESVTFNANTNIIFNLQGYKLTTTKRFINLGNLSIIDDSLNKSGMIENTKETVIQNDGSLTLDSITIKGDTNYSTIYASQGTGEISIKDSTIDSQDNAISIYSKQNLTIENSTINAKAQGIYTEVSGIEIEFKSGTINADGQGIRFYNVHDTTVNILEGTINSKGDGIYVYGYNNTFNITTADITSQNNCAIETPSYGGTQNHFNISAGNYSGGDYGIVTHSTHLKMTGGTVTCKSNRNDRYAIYHDYYSSSDLKNVTINSINASGMYINDSATIEDTEINVGHANGYGIYHYGGNITIKGDTKITNIGNSSYGIYHIYNTIDIKNINIESSNIGIYLSNTGNINLDNGTIKARKKGIYLNHNDTIINIGSLDDELSISRPLVKGEEYGIYKEAGTANFYNGVLIGKNYGYYGDLGNLRPKMKVTEETVLDDTSDYLTYTTANKSEIPTSEYAKEGNGYARITYIGETNESCTNGDITNFNFIGDEATFTTPCDGKYKLEVWGASGAYASESRHGGPGGYSKGEILLSKDEILYINVGGQGKGGPTGEGGYNGGGSSSSSGGPGGGGGATHIAFKSGLLSSLENNKDKVIIVAGGGGGFATYGCSTSIGGSGGGYIGSPDELGGTQIGGGSSSGQPNGSFGQGSYAYDTSQSTPGAGGGYYGGGTRTNSCVGGGGSGYIGHTRLSSAAMYGYNVTSSGGEYIKNYLIEKENFLQVDDVLFNDFNDAIKYIKDNKNGVGTILLLKEASVNDSVLFESGTDITFDLQGYKLITTERLHNQGTLTIIDSTDTKKGIIECINDVTLENEGNLTVNDITIKSSDSSGSSTIYAKSGTGTININNATLDATFYGLNIDAQQKININNTSITSVNDGIYIDKQNVELYMKDCTIDSNDLGIYLDGSHYSKITIEDTTVTSKNQSLYIYGQSMDIALDNNTFTSNTSTCIECPSYGSNQNKININDGTYNGHAYGFIIRNANFEMTGGTVNNEHTRTDYYAVFHNYYSTVRFTGTTINAKGTSGIYSDDPLYLYGTTVNALSDNVNGIYNYNGTLYVEEGTKITATGIGSNGIYNLYGSVNYNDGTIEADNAGIYNNTDRVVNIYGGTIRSKTYGVQQNGGTVTVGNIENENSITEPYIEGGYYGFIKTNGTSSFYSGKLKGNTHPYDGTFNNVREGYEIFEEPEDASLYQLKYKSVSTASHSDTAIRESAKEGNGYAKLTYHNTEYVKSKYTDNTPLVKAVYDYDYKYGYQTFEVPTTGTYKVELWGAQGNTPKNHRSLGGKGAYTSGTIELTKGEKLYVYVGEYREDREPSFNAGTTGGSGSDTVNGGSTNGYGGGGATDIRLEKGSWNLSTSLASRIMVAAGGGGGSDYAYPAQGGYGGTLVGGSGDTGIYPNRVNYNTPPTGGTQTSGGAASITRGLTGTAGSFGIGGQGQSSWGSAGGGGYYGGGGGGYSDYTVDSGAGGSSYISGYTGSVAISSRTSLVPRKNSNGITCQNNTDDVECSKHYSGKVFSNTTMIAGNETMPDYKTNNSVVGNTGSGHARITLLLNDNKDYVVTFVNEQGTNISKEYSNNEEIGNLPIPTTERTDIVFEGWYLEPNYINKIDENYVVTKDMNVYAKYLYKKAANNGIVPTTFTEDDIIVNNTVSYNFNYTGSEQTFTVLESGYYRLETWGAQGGKAVWPEDVEYRGGYGAYTSGQIYLSAGDVLYINVGGQGTDDCKTSCSGGYNGGGRASGRADTNSPIYNVSAGSGGGATHIATKSGTLSSLENDKSSIIMVSGGGGGSLIHRYGDASNHWQGYGGSGGGMESTAGSIPVTGRSIPPTVATQTSPGIGYTQSREVSRGSFGKGMDGDTVVNVEGDGAGAGGGYYGGGSSIYTSTSGGSGYINNAKLTNAYMACYGCTTSNDVSTKTISINDTSATALKDNAKEGNGYARITKIKSVNNNLVTTYGYTGSEETFVVPEDGYYKLETWGAQGGNSINKYATNIGGYGSYSTGNIYLHKDDVLYINVGGKANDTEDILGTIGGYNGGGNGGNAMMSNAYSDREYRAGAGGGGATHIALKSGLLSSFDTNENNEVDSNELTDLIIVSGGGGGATSHWNQGMNGGSAGGYKGLDGINCLTNPSSDHCSSFAGNSSGGTQTTGYSFGKGQAGLETAENGDWNQSGRGGGGGGLYGGFASQAQTWGAAAGGGGSGFINTSKLSSAYMACYGCEVSNESATKTKSVDKVSDDAVKDSAKSGNGYVKITKLSSDGSDLTTTYNYTGSEQTFIAPRDGYYKLETWGAQGGDYNNTYIGGYGGYSTGVVELNQGDTLYVNVGGQGITNCTSNNCPGGYNGGGSGAGASGIVSTSGGGATHIARESGLLSTFEDKRTQLLIVSGGGGGTSYENGYTGLGGSGGGAQGVDGTYTNSLWPSGQGGTQETGGAGGAYLSGQNVERGRAGTFGLGGIGVNYSGGGGGGYYGGGASNQSGAGGGSGYIGNSALQNKHMACFNCIQSDLVDTKTITVTSFSDEAIEDFAKKGDGVAKITYISDDDAVNVEFKTNYGTLPYPSKTYVIGDTIGTLPIPTLSDNTMIFKGWYLEPTYNTKVNENYVVQSNVRLFAKFMYASDSTCMIDDGEEITFDYTGTEQSYTIACGGEYTLEVWGAQGGGSNGGYGSYSRADITFDKGEKIYINVGGQGQRYDGGYNGGGQGGEGDNQWSYGGGGATHIATTSGLLSTFKDNIDKLLIVAGAGGGAGGSSNNSPGGSGGGYKGGTGFDSYTNNYSGYNATGATQSSGGYSVNCGSNNTISNGKFGQGGDYCNSGYGGAGGGAGYYGGGGSNRGHGGAGGGTGYVGNPRLTNMSMYGYNIEEKNTDYNSKVAYLIVAQEFIKNTNKPEGSNTYKNLQDAFNEANDGDVLELMTDATLTYDVRLDDVNVTLDLKGYDLLTNKQITNNSTLSIINSSTTKKSKLYTTLSSQLINNLSSATLSIDNIELKGINIIKNNSGSTLNINNSKIDATTTAIENIGSVSITDSTLLGNTYAYYDSSQGTSTITNSTLTSLDTAIYKNSSGTLTIVDTNITGTINNNNANSIVGIGIVDKQSININGKISNNGKMNISKSNISYVSGNVYSTENLIYNNGIMNLTDNNVSYTSTFTGNYERRTVYNIGTLTSTNNKYYIESLNGNYSYYFGILNEKILTSTNDEIEINRCRRAHGIYAQNNNHDTNITGTDIKIYNVNEEDFGIVSINTNVIISSATIESYNNRSSKGIALNNSGTATANNLNIDLHDNTDSYGLYVYDGSLTVQTGIINAKGTNAYGMYMLQGEYIQGTYDGSGNESADVSTSNPYVRAEGTTKGIGVSMGDGNMSFYDGYIYGSTRALAQDDIINNTEKNYQVLFEEANKKATLEYTKG